LGRRANTDPIQVYYQSPYAVFDNSPIAKNDPNGDCTDCPESTPGTSGNPSGNAYSQPDQSQPAELEDFSISAKPITPTNPAQAYSGATPTLPADPNGSIRPSRDGLMSEWGKSNNSFGKATYGLADGLYVTAQNLGLRQLQGRTNAVHLGGGMTNGNEDVGAFASAAGLAVMPFGGAEAEAFEVAADVMEQGTFSVYQGFNYTTGEVEYIGMTGREPSVRFAEHLRSTGTGKELLRYRVVPGATKLTKMNARILEQKLINQHGLDNLLNMRNSIAPKYWEGLGIK